LEQFVLEQLPMRKRLLLLSLSAFALSANGGPLTEAKVTKIINDVRIVRPSAPAKRATIDEVITGETGLQTGIKSRSELLFQDDTLTRVGPETYFSFKPGTRDMSLERGTMLLQVPKGLGGARIRTAAVTASITGTTILIEHKPKRDIKVLVLEGSLRLSINGTFGDSLLLTPGKMVIMRPDARRIPDPVTVDLARVIRTSSLVKMKGRKGESLPSMAFVEKEISRQEGQKGRQLTDTNLLIAGGGTNVILASDNLLASVDRHSDVVKSAALAPPLPPPAPPLPPADVGPAPTIHQDGCPNHDEHTEVRYGDGGHPVSTPIALNTSQDWTAHGGTGKIQITSNDSVAVNTTLKVSDVTSKHSHGEISIDSRKTTGTAIAISSSAQLLALLSAASGGHDKITFQSAGGDVNVDGATIQADRGTVDLRNNGASGIVSLTNATLHGEVVKIGALGSNGTLNVGGGTIDAGSTIRLYAGGSNGTVNFTDNVTLSGNSAKTIAGDTVTIFNGKIVTVLGNAPASVFTNNPNYTGFGGNGTTTGTFAGQGANTHSLAGAPGF
jgi:hypothetical protein